jgi:type I restriction enzyme S subunit
MVHKGDFLLTNSMSFGRPYITNVDGCIHDGWLVISPIANSYYQDFLYFLLSSAFAYSQFADKVSGAVVKNLNSDKVSEALFPLPPTAEQYRICSKLDALIGLSSKYQAFSEDLKTLDSSLLGKIKKSILQEAIQGKLVPQIASEGTAESLLEEIRIEKERLIKEKKIKRDKLDSVIFKGDDNKYYEKNEDELNCIDDEIPFDIPASWRWSRLGSVFAHNTGKALNGAGNGSLKKKYLTTSNLYWDYFDFSKVKEMNFTESEIDKCTVRHGDLLVCEGGDIGRAAIWNYDYDICIQNHIHRLRAYKAVATRYFLYVLWFYKSVGLIGGKGIGIQGLSSGALHNILLPMPPLSEQWRIVERLEFVLASIMRK